MAITTRPAAAYVVRVNNIDEPGYRLLTVSHSAGGGAVPSRCTFESFTVPANLANGLQDNELQDVFSNQTCEVRVSVNQGGVAVEKVVHFGRIVKAGYVDDQQNERIVLESRFDHYLMGEELRQIQCAFRAVKGPNIPANEWSSVLLDGELVFNPIKDSRTIPNALQHQSGPGNKWSVVDEDSILWSALNTYIQANQDVPNPPADGTGFGYWNLSEVVYYLCWLLNPNETYIANPTRAELTNVLNTDQRIVRNLKMNMGNRLPQLLDAALAPYGYQWKVDFTGVGTRKITVYRRDTGPPIFPKIDRFGETLNYDAAQGPSSNAATTRINLDYVRNAVNEVTVLGDFPVVESTFELMPAWLPAYDASVDPQEFRASISNWDDPNIRRAWRDFVLNENGDYNGLRPDARYAQRYDLSILFPDGLVANAVRKRFHPTVTLALDGTPIGETHGTHVEYWEPDLEEWLPVRGGEDQKGGIDGGKNVQILTNECGIRFASPETPPVQLMAIAKEHGIENVKIRITASVKADQKISAFVATMNSLLIDPRRKTVDSAKQFRYRAIDAASIYKPLVTAGTMATSEVDGRAGALTLANDLLLKWQRSSVNGTIDVEGLDWDGIDLGDHVAGLSDRNVGFRASHPLAPAAYPTITSINWNVETQRTTLGLDTYRATGPPPPGRVL